MPQADWSLLPDRSSPALRPPRWRWPGFKKLALLLACIVAAVVLISILLTLPLRWYNPGSTAFTLRDENIDEINLRQHWTSYEAISPEILLALIAAEDQKFPEHYGFDFESLKKALAKKEGRRRGASTISQQLVKNLYLWSGRSIFRKGVEAWLTLWLELLVSKQRILEIYVNVIEFDRGVYGIGLASKHFYGISPLQINRFQASMLATVLPNPKSYNILQPSPYILRRAATIRRGMRALGGTGYLQALD